MGYLLFASPPSTVAGHANRPSRLEGTGNVQYAPHVGKVKKTFFAQGFRRNITDAKHLVRIGEMEIICIIVGPVQNIAYVLVTSAPPARTDMVIFFWILTTDLTERDCPGVILPLGLRCWSALRTSVSVTFGFTFTTVATAIPCLKLRFLEWSCV